MRVAYFDCFSGASGDMLLGSLVDAGLAFEALTEDVGRLGLGGYRLEAERATRHGLTGTQLRVLVETQERPARTLPTIRTLIHGADLPATVKARSLATFARLARAEAMVHGTGVDEVHFHEIGAVDSLVDIVGFACGLERLGIEAVYSSAVTLGSGTVQTEHGWLPVPAPATLALLAEVGAPTRPSAAQTELLTPTGAALLTEFAHFERPPMAVRAVGYGFGTKELRWPNAVRVWLADREEEAWFGDAVVELACNLDDTTGEALGYTMERLFAAGALDVWFTPIQMKKNRPGVLLTVLTRPEEADSLAAVILRETPTLGLRRTAVSRRTAGREMRSVETPWGPVRVKVKLMEGRTVAASPEYVDCARVATQAGVPFAEVMAVAERLAREGGWIREGGSTT